ncbi:substrate-binding domain-containing protein [Actinoplanes sp. NPDC026619]|uniref:sugar ABC transporter substrate-binding protein n=1 Tax=Actinoplanes sp. NPDC026619 TaxID=3155798 RepID=UPI00341051AA
MDRPLRLLAVLPLVAALGLASCGDDSGGGTADTKKMSFVVANISLNFALEMANGGKYAAEEVGGIDLKVVGPATTDGPQEVQMFQNATTTNRDGAVVENLAPDLFTRPYAQAVARGIPVVALDTVPLKGSDVELYVGNDNFELGTQLAEEAIKKLPAGARGTVVVGVPNPGVPVLDQRVKGIKDTFAKKLPGIVIKGPFQTFSDPGQSYNAWSSQVRANSGALAFLGVGDADSYSLARLKRETRGTWLSGGFDLDAKTLEAVKDGTNFATISPEHYLKGYVAMRLLAESVTKGADLPQGWFYTPGLVVDSGNIDAIITRQQSDATRRQGIAADAGKLFANPGAYLKPLADAR